MFYVVYIVKGPCKQNRFLLKWVEEKREKLSKDEKL